MDNWKNEQLEMADLGNWKCGGFQNWGHWEFGIKNKLGMLEIELWKYGLWRELLDV